MQLKILYYNLNLGLSNQYMVDGKHKEMNKFGIHGTPEFSSIRSL